MTDQEILMLLYRRDKEAVSQMQSCYHNYCYSIANHILIDEQDAMECCNDVWLQAWEHIPPAEPENLRLYLGKTARNIALNRLEQRSAQKRSGITVQLEELAEVIPDRLHGCDVEQQHLSQVLSRFVGSLGIEQRQIFLRRYWYGDTVEELAVRFGCSQSRITGILHRTRKKLKKQLEKEDCF